MSNGNSNFLTYVESHVDGATDHDLNKVANLCRNILYRRRYNRHLTKTYNDFFLKAMELAQMVSVSEDSMDLAKLRLFDMKVVNPSDTTGLPVMEPVAIAIGDLEQIAAYGTLCDVLHRHTGRFFRYHAERVNGENGGSYSTVVLEISGMPFKG